MAENEDYKSLRARFQKNLEDHNERKKLPTQSGTKPTIPAKPILGPTTNRCFQKPVPKAISSPELPVFLSTDRMKIAGNNFNSVQSHSKIQGEKPKANPKEINPSQALNKTETNRMFSKPGVTMYPKTQVVKPNQPKPFTNTAVKNDVESISPRTLKACKIPVNEKCTNIPSLKLLPSEAVLGPNPKKPKRPPFVHLEKFKKSCDSEIYVAMRSHPGNSKQITILRTSQSQPNLVSISPSRSGRPSLSTNEEQDVYEEVIHFCSVKKDKSTSLQHIALPENAAGKDELYDDVESIADQMKPRLCEPSPVTETNVLITNWRNEMNLKKIEKQEKEFRKKFQFAGRIKVLTRMMVDPNAIVQKAGWKDLPYTRGEILDVIQLTNQEKILCRNSEGNFGYVPRKAVLKLEINVFDDVIIADEIYDDTELLSRTFPAAPPKPRFQHGYVSRIFQRNQSQSRGSNTPEMLKKNLKNSKNEEKVAKELKKKFKIEGEIKVLTRMMVVPSAGNKRGGGKDLPISKGEILDVMQYTNQEKLLCRNSKGKYGYVKRRYVLQLENEVC
ncbi:FYN-binding protein 1-like isoform X2 [Ascaphus truei]|uniref:FYN-binding protein 1-like isoform X1 n=2 Tax=Ascaphus truei TaxID=8439 RepID=UPI003F59651E